MHGLPRDTQPKVIPLWSEVTSGEERQSPETALNWGGQKIVRNVSQPSLLVYPADSENNTGIAVVIAPGGGFRFLAIEQEGELVAQWLNQRGINAFVLKYRLEQTPANRWCFNWSMYGLFAGAAIKAFFSSDSNHRRPLSPVQEQAISDGLRAVELVRKGAETWKLRTDAIGILGFSAGGAVATGVAVQGENDSRPDFAGSIYGVPATGDVPQQAPPLFVATANNDAIVPAQWSQSLHDQWLASDRDSTLVRYVKGGHGFGMKKQGHDSDSWIVDFYDWLMSPSRPFGRR